MRTILQRLVPIAFLVLAAAPAQAAELEGPLMQGGLVVGTAAPGSQVIFDGQQVRVSPEGTFVIGFGRDAAQESVLTLRAPGGREAARRLAIAERSRQVQRIDGLPKRQVTPPESVWKRIKAEQDMIVAVRRRDSALLLLRDGFAWPAQGRISGVYGSQRILNGKPKRPHFGVDVAAPKGTPVHAAAAGVVALMHDDMYYTGKTVMLDHGHGVTSVYIHMSKIVVRDGETVRQGQPIGAIGKSGRATGPHLHWGVYWGETPLDPALLVPPMPASAAKK